jgi:hypothetical protein
MRLDQPRRLTEPERQVLNVLLAPEFDGVADLRAQALVVEVIGGCDCGCPTIYFVVPPDACPSDDLGPGRRLAPVEGRVMSGSMELGDVILLFVDGGLLTTLEYAWVGDAVPTEWLLAEQMAVVPTGSPAQGG